jgi:antitoxin component YwqK of YwqJK toxin-antitoxin module
MENSGLVQTYCKNLNGIDYVEEEYFQLNGKKHGLYTLYDPKGFIVRKMEFVEGNIHGEYISYHNFSNNIHYKCHYNNGIKVGEAVFYYEDGQIEDICYYENGKIEGMRYCYHKSDDNSIGKLKRSCNYINGLIQGDCIIYNKDGTIRHFWNYVDDKIIN